METSHGEKTVLQIVHRLVRSVEVVPNLMRRTTMGIHPMHVNPLVETATQTKPGNCEERGPFLLHQQRSTLSGQDKLRASFPPGKSDVTVVNYTLDIVS